MHPYVSISPLTILSKASHWFANQRFARGFGFVGFVSDDEIVRSGLLLARRV